MTMTFRPMGDRVLVRRRPPETVSDGGLHIDPEYASKNRKAVVLAVGPGRARTKVIRTRMGPKGPIHTTAPTGVLHPCTVKPGDLVYVARTGGQEVTVDGEDLLVLREESILGIVEDA